MHHIMVSLLLILFDLLPIKVDLSLLVLFAVFGVVVGEAFEVDVDLGRSCGFLHLLLGLRRPLVFHILNLHYLDLLLHRHIVGILEYICWQCGLRVCNVVLGNLLSVGVDTRHRHLWVLRMRRHIIEWARWVTLLSFWRLTVYQFIIKKLQEESRLLRLFLLGLDLLAHYCKDWHDVIASLEFWKNFDLAWLMIIFRAWGIFARIA